MKVRKPNYEKPLTIIGEDTVIEGNLFKSKSSLQINGTYIGNLEIESSLVVGEQGKIEGNIKADFILVAGTLKGNTDCNYQIHITPTGKVIGDINCGTIIIEDGGSLEGACKMKSTSSDRKEIKEKNQG
jgi:cytoskeletal protein CcmA (bactofilin family)